MITATWRDRPGSLPERLAAELRDQISLGHIGPGAPMPAERQLASRAEVSRTTAAAALDILAGSGWAVRRNRARTVARLPDVNGQALAPDTPDDVELDLLAALTAAPVELVDAAIARAAVALRSRLLGPGRDPLGIDELRSLVADRFSADGLPTTIEQVLITNGALGALNSVLDATPGPVLVEDPTYRGALELLAARKRRLVPWTRFHGWDLEALHHRLRRDRPTVAYLIPDFHNPTGTLANESQRRSLIGLDQRLAAVVIDETLRPLDLRTGAEPLPRPLGHHLPAAITIGGLSKVIWSGLRIGWLRIDDARRRADLARFTATQPPPVLDQLVAVELWPHLDAIMAGRIDRLRAQRDTLAAALGAAGLSATTPAGGLVMWVDLGRPVATELSRRLAARGVLLAPGGLFSPTQPADRFVRLPFTHDQTTLGRVVELVAEELGRF